MTYHRGTLEEFNTWHDASMIAEGIPTPDGKVGFVEGVLAPQNQRTVAYSHAILHPTNADDYLWSYGEHPDAEKTSLSITESQTIGWFQNEQT